MKINLDMNESAITDVLELASELVGIRTLFIGALDENFSVMKVFSRENGSDIEENMVLPRNLSVCNLVCPEEPLVIENTVKDARTAALDVIYTRSIGAYLGAPIILEDGRMFGTLCAVDPDPYAFNQKEVQAMRRLANILSALIYKNQAAIIPEIEEKILHLDKLALVGQLAAGLAHEIRNPMQSVRGFIQLLFHENEKVSEFQHIVLSELDRMNQLIHDFLLVTQPSAPKKESASIVKVVNQTIELLRNEAALHNIKIELDTEGEIPDLLIDPSQMKQVMINLVKNAIEAIESNGKVDITIRKREKEILIFIRDDGPGIPLSIINRVGDPFFSTKDNNGIGLGLSICKTIIREHQGDIKIESAAEGTLITVTLPVAGV